MRIYELPPRTSSATIAAFGEPAKRNGSLESAAEAWTQAGFGDEETGKWLEVRCFDPQAAHDLAELGVTPAQAGTRTRDGGDFLDTIAFKVSNGDLTARQGAARCMSSR